MSDTSARHGPAPSASLNSVKLDQHQPTATAVVGTAAPSAQVSDPAPGFDVTTVMLLALFFAVVVVAFWKVLLRLVLVAAVTLVFAGVFVVPLMVMQH